jgi:hypothetical protein
MGMKRKDGNTFFRKEWVPVYETTYLKEVRQLVPLKRW